MYLGVHSTPDLVGGSMIGLTVLLSFESFDDAIDEWVTKNPASIILPTLLCIVLLMASCAHSSLGAPL